MTDWLPWGGVLMAGTLTTLGLALRALGNAAAGTRPDLKPARVAFAVTAVLSVGLYVLYLVRGEDWLWY